MWSKGPLPCPRLRAPMAAALWSGCGRSCRVERIYRRGMTTMLERLSTAMNDHDAQRLASHFARDYQSIQPLHPSRGFGGSAQVLENWSSVFDGCPTSAQYWSPHR